MRALITGASGGIGRDMAICLSKKGYDLVLVARNGKKLERLKKHLKTNVEIIPMDLSVKENCFILYESMKQKEIHLLINNAGFGLFGPFTDTSLDTELNMIELNICAVHILTKLFLKQFKKRGFGKILNVASSAAFLPGPLMAAYYATKAYVLRLTQAIQEELRQQKSPVTISALCPGPVATDFHKRANVTFRLKEMKSMTVAKYGLKKMFQGQSVIIPGTLMKIAAAGEKVLPDKALLKCAYHFQKRKGD